MATRAALDAMGLKEAQRHNKQTEKMSWVKTIADTVIGGVSAASNAVRTIGGMIATAAAAGDPADFRHNDNEIAVATQHAYANKKGKPIVLSGQLELIDAGIVVADYLPTIGTLKGADYNTPVQAMFQKIFQVIRGKNSGSTNYDYVDLGQVIIALDSMRIVFEEITRALDLSLYSQTMNSYTIRSIVKSLGYDVDFINTNRLAIISLLNKFATDMNKLALPGNLPYFRRHANLSGHVLTDRIEGTHRNYYAYKCKGYYVYDELNARLIFHQVSDSNNYNYRKDLTKLKNLLNQFVTSFQRSDAVTIMAGDVEKAVDNGAIAADALFSFPTISLDDSLSFYHKELFWCNELDLSSFRNMTIFGYTVDSNYNIGQYFNASTGANFIYQGTLDGSNIPNGVLVANPSQTGRIYPANGDSVPKLLIRTDFDQPSDDSVIEDTRFAVYYNIPNDTFLANSTPVAIGSHGSEIIVGLNVYVYTDSNAWKADNPSAYTIGNTFFQIDSEISDLKNLIRIYNNIPYMPALYVDCFDSDATPLIFAPYYNATTYTKEEIADINDLALRSLFFFDPKASSVSTYSISNSGKPDTNSKANNNKNNNKGNKRNKNKGKGKGKGKDKGKEEGSTGDKKPDDTTK